MILSECLGDCMINTHIDTQKVAQNFAKAHATYAQSAIVQNQMCHTLMALLPKLSPKRVLEVGCGVGNLTDIYYRLWQIETLYLNDLYDFVPKTKATLLIGDIETLPLPQELDLVLSGSAFQWIKDLPVLLTKMYHALKRGGVLAFSSFGKDNLYQIKHLTGIGLDYHHPNTIAKMLSGAGFKVLSLCQDYETLYFKSPKDILAHIKDTGVAITGMHWTKSSLAEFYQGYERFVKDGGYPLTYHPVYVVAVRP